MHGLPQFTVSMPMEPLGLLALTPGFVALISGPENPIKVRPIQTGVQVFFRLVITEKQPRVIKTVLIGDTKDN